MPERSGLKYWVDRAQADGIQQVGWEILRSPEFENRNPTNRSKVKALYWAAFRRAPDSTGWDYWTAQLNSGQITWRNLTYNFMFGPEMNNKVVAAFYQPGSYHHGLLDKARPKRNTIYHEAYSLVNGYFEYWYTHKVQHREWLDQGYWALPATPGYNKDSTRYDRLNWADDGCSFDFFTDDPDNGNLVYTQGRYCEFHDFYYRNFGSNADSQRLDATSAVKLQADSALKRLSDASCNRRYAAWWQASTRNLCLAESSGVYWALRTAPQADDSFF